MQCILKYCVLPLLFLEITSSDIPENDYAHEFQEFVMITLTKFCSTLDSRKRNQNQPEDFNTKWTYSAKIWNQPIFNHGSKYRWEIKSDLEAFNFTIQLDFIEYVVEEDLEEGQPVVGSGKLDLNIVPNPKFCATYLHISFEKFAITSAWFVNTGSRMFNPGGYFAPSMFRRSDTSPSGCFNPNPDPET